MESSKEALFIDCLKLPSTPFIRIIIQSSGKIKNKKLPINKPNGKSNRFLLTPNLAKSLFVKKSCINKERILKEENQNPKKDANSSGFRYILCDKSLN